MAVNPARDPCHSQPATPSNNATPCSVAPATGCFYLGTTYQHMERFYDPSDKCRDCICSNGTITCQHQPCAPVQCSHPLQQDCCRSCDGNGQLLQLQLQSVLAQLFQETWLWRLSFMIGCCCSLPPQGAFTKRRSSPMESSLQTPRTPVASVPAGKGVSPVSPSLALRQSAPSLSPGLAVKSAKVSHVPVAV